MRRHLRKDEADRHPVVLHVATAVETADGKRRESGEPFDGESVVENTAPRSIDPIGSDRHVSAHHSQP